jgi:AcrR family transcriptional regulator
MRSATAPPDSGPRPGGVGRAGGVVSNPPGRPRDAKVSESILDAALRQLADIGYARMSMESVAHEAGVSRSTVYRRYQDKADLVTAAIAQNAGTIDTAGPSSDPKADLVRFLREFDERFGEHCLEILGTLLGAREDPRALELHRERVIAPRMRYARGLLERAQESGTIGAASDVDLALQMLAGSVFARHVSGVSSPADWAERAVAIVWQGLSAP